MGFDQAPSWLQTETGIEPFTPFWENATHDWLVDVPRPIDLDPPREDLRVTYWFKAVDRFALLTNLRDAAVEVTLAGRVFTLEPADIWRLGLPGEPERMFCGHRPLQPTATTR